MKKSKTNTLVLGVGNDILTSLLGLSNIESESINDLFISNNNLLIECEALRICNYLANPNGIVDIHDNAPGCNSQDEVEEACVISVPETKTGNHQTVCGC